MPRWLEKLLDNDDVNMWVYGIFALAAPQIIFNFVITYTLPKLSVRLTKYPETLPEVTESSDNENPSKTKQIKGKQQVLLFQRENFFDQLLIKWLFFGVYRETASCSRS